MRPLLVCLVLALSQAAGLADTASEQLKARYLLILKREMIEMLRVSEHKADTDISVPLEASSLMGEISMVYGPSLTLPEPEAARLLATGPDDRLNSKVMQRELRIWRKVPAPLPALYKQMQDDLQAGKITGGLSLDLTRRISEFHLRQLRLL